MPMPVSLRRLGGKRLGERCKTVGKGEVDAGINAVQKGEMERGMRVLRLLPEGTAKPLRACFALA